VYSNVGRDCFGAGFTSNTFNRPSSYGSYPISIFNNVIVRAGSPANGKRCINIARQSTADAEVEPQIYNNTCVEADGGGIGVGSSNSPCIVRDNLLAGTSGQRTITAGHCVPSNNLQDTVANMDFDDAASDDYRLTVDSAARNAASGGPSDDFEGDSRPKQSISDIGADEYAP
jgi:hypothetical protein